MILTSSAENSSTPVRRAAVAGQFYPAASKDLKKQIHTYLDAAPKGGGSVSMLISPHAGYVFSGSVAAYGFNRVDPQTKTVFILGPAHHHWFAGIAIANVTAYETPLGRMPLNLSIVAKLRKSPLVHVVEQADAPEHSIEVQIPFLQVVCPQATIVPILCGDVSAQTVADLILPFMDDKTLVVASSDFSHYNTAAKAKIIDSESIKTILDNNVDGALDACGDTPIHIIMRLAQRQNLHPVLLNARNSGETAPQYKSDGKVVGYASMVFESGPASSSTIDTDLPLELKQWLLQLTRASLNAAVEKKPAPRSENIPAIALEKSGCFVTLTIDGNLRGCIGYIEPVMPLYKAIMDNAKSAALRDDRFVPVGVGELPSITVEVSVLTTPEPLLFSSPQDLLDKLKPGVHGVILTRGNNQSTFLPQVWEQLTDKEEFLAHLSQKAGMEQDGWKTSSVKIYRAIHFSE